MRRLLVIGASGIALLAVAGVALVIIMTRGDGPPRAESPLAALPAPDAGPAPGVAVPQAGPAERIEITSIPTPPTPTLPPSEAPPPDSWEAVPPSAVPASLGPVGVGVAHGLADLRERLAECWDLEVEARHGMDRYSVARDGGQGGAGVQAAVMLHLETTSGGVRIVDAPVDTRGAAGDGVIACSQRLLRGRSFPVPGARAGERHRLRWALQP